MPRMNFAVAREDRPGGTVLVVRGELDIATVARLRDEVDAVLGSVPERLWLDLTGADFIDSTGCRELVRTAKGAAAAGIVVELIVPKDNWRVRRVVDFMQFGELLPVLDAAPYA